MITTFEAYCRDYCTKDSKEMMKFYVKRNSEIFLTAYALSCGYIDVWNNGRYEIMLDYSNETYRLRVRYIPQEGDIIGMRGLDFMSRRLDIIRKKQVQYIDMVREATK